ncbi:unnamed protein product [Cuscuta epithymum]|uniref:Late embryogenesis abundant protein LEA-2 subgroup domain-containing protein n=1 Tax=Cuscuta epithymum TaxID=186058 RepID=A0AAV0DBG7_9ASTE|nr:unnamed protein product [Cuscuta epithymum]CAH9145588.1 unnamed protein product [Cuscuta epithymum]
MMRSFNLSGYRSYRREFECYTCFCVIIKIVLLILIGALIVLFILDIIYSIGHPDPKVPAYSVLDAPLTTINDSSSGSTGGGGVTFILNTRNRNKKMYTNDVGPSSASLYLGGALTPAQELVANATLTAFLQPPLASTNFTLTFPAAVPKDTSSAVIKMTAQFRYSYYPDYDELQVSCQLSKRKGFDAATQCDVKYFSCSTDRHRRFGGNHLSFS